MKPHLPAIALTSALLGATWALVTTAPPPPPQEVLMASPVAAEAEEGPLSAKEPSEALQDLSPSTTMAPTTTVAWVEAPAPQTVPADKETTVTEIPLDPPAPTTTAPSPVETEIPYEPAEPTQEDVARWRPQTETYGTVTATIIGTSTDPETGFHVCSVRLENTGVQTSLRLAVNFFTEDGTEMIDMTSEVYDIPPGTMEVVHSAPGSFGPIPVEVHSCGLGWAERPKGSV